MAATTEQRFRVQFYTERCNSRSEVVAVEWCVCDFGAKVPSGVPPLGYSPIVSMDGRVQYTTTDRREAEAFADRLNKAAICASEPKGRG